MRILLQTLDTVPAALLKVVRNRDGTYIGRFRYGDRYLERRNAVELDPFKLPLGKDVHEFAEVARAICGLRSQRKRHRVHHPSDAATLIFE
jgi:hypothetical protein